MMIQKSASISGYLLIAVFVLGIEIGAARPLDALQDLTMPLMQEAEVGPGKRVKASLAGFVNTSVYHSLYLPKDWKPGKNYPVIVEYPGNRWKQSSSGRVEDCVLGYGLSAGDGYIWVCLPFISIDHKRNQLFWWGDIDATVKYCINAVDEVCRKYGGRRDAVILAGFSRGALACNYIGLHNDKIGSLWRGFICHDHYDGVKLWGYPNDDRESAARRLKRLDNRPQLICGEVHNVKTYLTSASPNGRFTYLPLVGWGHDDRWVLYQVKEREVARDWLSSLLQ